MDRHHVMVVDALVPVLVGVVIVVGEAVYAGRSDRPLPVVVALAAAATLWGRRRWPVATLAASAALVAVLFHIDASAGVVGVLAPAVALYSLALRRGRTPQTLAGLGAVAAILLADIVHSGRLTVLQTFGHVLLVSIPLLAAEAIRNHRAYLGVLEERLALAERTREQEAERRAEQERIRIARELHDVVAHTLTEINVQTAAAAERLGPGDPRRALEAIEDTSHRAVAELRAVLGVLRERGGPDAPRAPVPGLADIPDLLDRARTTGLDVAIHVRGEQPARISEASSLAAYRIVQESLTNARRHAPGVAVRVTLEFTGERMTIAVENPALGGPRNGTTSGVGIKGMRERAAAIGGMVRAGPIPAGFAVHAELPYQP